MDQNQDLTERDIHDAVAAFVAEDKATCWAHMSKDCLSNKALYIQCLSLLKVIVGI